MLVFAAVVWWPRVDLTISKRQLGRIQRLACLCITGAFRTTPTAALETLLSLPPLHTFVKREAMITSYRLNAIRQWKRGNLGHKRIWEQMRSCSTFHQFHSDHMTPKYFFGKGCEITFPSREDWLSSDLCVPEGAIMCFTDGSHKTELGLSGAGVYIPSLGVREIIPLGNYVTIFQAEIYYIISCL